MVNFYKVLLFSSIFSGFILAFEQEVHTQLDPILPKDVVSLITTYSNSDFENEYNRIRNATIVDLQKSEIKKYLDEVEILRQNLKKFIKVRNSTLLNDVIKLEAELICRIRFINLYGGNHDNLKEIIWRYNKCSKFSLKKFDRELFWKSLKNMLSLKDEDLHRISEGGNVLNRYISFYLYFKGAKKLKKFLKIMQPYSNLEFQQNWVDGLVKEAFAKE